MTDATVLPSTELTVPTPWNALRRLGPADVALFAELLAGLVRARVPLPEALKLLASDAENARVRRGFAALRADTAAGVSFQDALRKHRDLFPDLFIALIDSGMRANDLHGALLEIVREYRSQARFRDALWGQLLGPLATGILLVSVMTLLFWMNLPGAFADIYRSLRVELPFYTRVTLALNEWAHRPDVVIAVPVSAAGLVLIIIALWRNAAARRTAQTLLLRLPFVGSYVRTLVLGRFCRLTGILLARNMPLETALNFAAQSTRFLPQRQAVLALQRKVSAGQSFNAAVAGERFFPATFTHLISGAQDHGALPGTLERLADVYEGRLTVQGARLCFAIYFLATLALGLCVAWFALSFFSPLFRIQEALRKR
jgi:type II secretory pathway component PulF